MIHKLFFVLCGAGLMLAQGGVEGAVITDPDLDYVTSTKFIEDNYYQPTDEVRRMDLKLTRHGRPTVFLSFGNVGDRSGNVWSAYSPVKGGYRRINYTDNGNLIQFRTDWASAGEVPVWAPRGGLLVVDPGKGGADLVRYEIRRGVAHCFKLRSFSYQYHRAKNIKLISAILKRDIEQPVSEEYFKHQPLRILSASAIRARASAAPGLPAPAEPPPVTLVADHPATPAPEPRPMGPTEAPPVEVIDDGYGLVRTALPSVDGLKLRPAIQLLPPADFTKTRHLSFAKSVSREPDGTHDFVGPWSWDEESSFTRDQAGAAATAWLAENFPEFAARLKLRQADPVTASNPTSNHLKASWTSGYGVSFLVTSGGVQVADNYVNVTISGDHVMRVNFLVYGEPSPPAASPSDVGTIPPLDPRTALGRALPRVKEALGISAKYGIRKMELVYANPAVIGGKAADFDQDFILAWHVVIDPSPELTWGRKKLNYAWLNAANGEVLGVR